jgi:hypothetical protein
MDAETLTALVRAVLPGAAVTALPPLRGSENAHAEARLPDGTALFVKVYADAAKCRAERLVLDALAERYDWPVPPVAGGESWLAFPLLDLAPVTASPETLRAWGGRLAEVHACPPPGGLAEIGRAVDHVERRLDRLRACDPAVAATATALWDAVAGTVGAAAAERRTPPVLLSNDFGLRNTVHRPDGVLALIDFERADTGDPHWDLGRAWDIELTGAAERAAFLAGYRAVLPDATGLPHEPTLWVTRFVGAVGAVPYALRLGDPVFRRHALAVLDRLAAEV